MEKKRKPKKCEACGVEYMPFNTLQKACSPKCALKIVEIDKERKYRAETRKLKESLKGHRELTREAQQAFNWFIRERDHGKTCISCGGKQKQNNYRGHYVDCGHYRSVGSAPHLRFVEDNAHGQCVRCNRDLSGNVVEYRHRLIARIGKKRVEAIESDNKERKYSRDELKEIAKEYRKKARELKKQRGEKC